MVFHPSIKPAGQITLIMTKYLAKALFIRDRFIRPKNKSAFHT
jgi:hypothetical protein